VLVDMTTASETFQEKLNLLVYENHLFQVFQGLKKTKKMYIDWNGEKFYAVNCENMLAEPALEQITASHPIQHIVKHANNQMIPPLVLFRNRHLAH
jgi:hypothetical protein